MSGSWGGHKRGGGRRHEQGHGARQHRPRRDRAEVSVSSSPVVSAFQQIATELDAKHDRYERLVKLSRDITIESKRIIFLLHTITGDSNKKEILVQADGRLSHLEENMFRAVAMELKGEDPYQFLRAISAGLQEYIEAKTFYNYLKNKNLLDWKSIQETMIYEMKPIPTVIEPSSNQEEIPPSEPPAETQPTDPDIKPEKITTILPPTEYILGVADLTGELMRRCINTVGMGQIDQCYQSCAFMREIHRGFLGTSIQGCKELGRKLYVLRQSLVKAENACYTVHVRGSEVPKHLLADVLSMHGEEPHDEDEGFY